jgi:DNA-directed RNA polymerase subunit RPC12/RpoP
MDGEHVDPADFFELIAAAFPQQPGEQPTLEEHIYYCLNCSAKHEVVVDTAQDLIHMCPDCAAEMTKV